MVGHRDVRIFVPAQFDCISSYHSPQIGYIGDDKLQKQAFSSKRSEGLKSRLYGHVELVLGSGWLRSPREGKASRLWGPHPCGIQYLPWFVSITLSKQHVKLIMVNMFCDVYGWASVVFRDKLLNPLFMFRQGPWFELPNMNTFSLLRSFYTVNGLDPAAHITWDQGVSNWWCDPELYLILWFTAGNSKDPIWQVVQTDLVLSPKIRYGIRMHLLPWVCYCQLGFHTFCAFLVLFYSLNP